MYHKFNYGSHLVTVKFIGIEDSKYKYRVILKKDGKRKTIFFKLGQFNVIEDVKEELNKIMGWCEWM